MNVYLLIGGRSRRMGQSKVELPFGGSTFMARSIERARDVFDRVYAVQRAGGTPATGVETIFELPHDDEAPAFGVLCALEHAGIRCFVMAVDYPLMTSEVLGYLARRTEGSPASLVAPRWSERLQMLCAGYDAAAHSIPGRYGVFEGQGGAFGTPGGGTYKGGVHVEERPAIDRPRGMSSRGY